MSVSAAALILSYPKPSWSLLAWVAFIPFFITNEDSPSRERFRNGYLLGFLVSLGVFYWVTFSMRHYGHLNLLTSISMLVLMALYLALYPALFLWAWGLRPARGLFPLFSAPQNLPNEHLNQEHGNGWDVGGQEQDGDADGNESHDGL